MSLLVLFGSAGRIRTYNQLVTLVPLFPKGVDYIIIRVIKWMIGCEVLRAAYNKMGGPTPVRDSL